MKKGLIIRHLMLPNYIENSKRVISWISENISTEVFISIMSQYFPCYKAKEMEDINRKISAEEYSEIENFIFDLNIENGYMQDFEPDEDEEKYVPDFKNKN